MRFLLFPQLFVFSFTTTICSNCYSQNKKTIPQKKQSAFNTPPKIAIADTATITDYSPEFMGGNEAYQKFLQQELVYPTIINRNKRIASVRVMAEFIVNNDGSLSDFEYDLDFEVLGKHTQDDIEEMESEYANYYKTATKNFLLKMPAWKPAQTGVEKVSTHCALPIVFRYNDAIEKPKKEGVFALVEKEPQYIGGTDAMHKFIKKNLILPKSDTTKTEEKVLSIVVSFIIEKDGTVSDIKIDRGNKETEQYENSIIQCFKKMPKWSPAYQDGKPIRAMQRETIRIIN